MNMVQRTSVACFVVLVLPLILQAAPIEIAAQKDIWIREVSPGTTFENDLVSVWASNAAGTPDAGKRRYGLIEFDLSSLVGQPLVSATLQLFSTAGGSQARTPMKQHAFIINSAGTQLGSLTWDSYMAEKDAGKLALEGLGRFDQPAINDTPALQNAYSPSDATAADLALLQSEINGDKILSLVLIADEDGNDYRRDWGDNGYITSPAILQVTIPEAGSLSLLALGVALIRQRRFR